MLSGAARLTGSYLGTGPFPVLVPFPIPFPFGFRLMLLPFPFLYFSGCLCNVGLSTAPPGKLSAFEFS